MSKQVSLFKFFVSGMLKTVALNQGLSMVKSSNKFSDAEDTIKRDVKMLLKDVIQKTVSSERSKINSY